MVTDQQREARNAADRAKRLAKKEKARDKAEEEYKKSNGQLKNAKDYLTKLKRQYRDAPSAKLGRMINLLPPLPLLHTTLLLLLLPLPLLLRSLLLGPASRGPGVAYFWLKCVSDPLHFAPRRW